MLLSGSGRVTTVKIIATCAEGDHLHVNVTLSQGSASGFGVGQGECTGRLEKYPVTVPAEGRDGFFAGAARVQAEADIRESGVIVDAQQWTRNVQIVPAP